MSNIPPSHKLSRPQGLWKARASGTPRLATKIDKPLREQRIHLPLLKPANIPNDDGNDSDTSFSSSSSSSRKRRRLSPTVDTPSTSDGEPEYYHWHTARRCTPERPQFIHRRSSNKMLNSSSTASGSIPEDRTVCNLEDWEDLKELFAKAQDSYDSAEPAETLPLLRGVIHECHQFLVFYEDPSVLFVIPSPPPPPPPPIKRDWSGERYDNPYHKVITDRVIPKTVYKSTNYPSQDQKCKCIELPTAFHCILGTSLFYFGNLIAQNPSLALDGEPNSPMPYWLATLDVFETGENLPSRTSGRGCDAPEDWRMAIMWGRTLVSIADEMVRRSAENPDAQALGTSMFSADEPAWPPESPFSAIAMRRPPVTRRMSFSSATPHDLLVLAMDQFSRGIFHMPHPKKLNHWQMKHESNTTPAVPPATKPSRPTTTINPQPPFSRSKELFTIASEVLLLAEKLELPSERRQWASFADSVFSQMKLEGFSYVHAKSEADAASSSATGVGPTTTVPGTNVEDVDILARARGRCWLIVGSAHAEGLESALERGEMEVLETEDAEDAREALQSAIDYFSKARGRKEESEMKDDDDEDDDDDDDLPALLAEAYVTLANLTVDSKRRDELYALAEKEGGPTLGLAEDEPMNVD